MQPRLATETEGRSGPAARAEERSHTRLRQLAWLALAVAVAYLAWRGILRGIGYDQDLNVGYSAARAWIFGDNPYDAAILREILAATGDGDIAFEGSLAWRLNVYFPPTLLLFLPVAFLPWMAANLLVIGLNVAATAAIGLGVLRLVAWGIRETRSLWLLAFLLALAPVHSSIAAGQTGLIATAALVGALLLERSRRAPAAGVAYGMATALKVQIGVPFLAYLVWRRRWSAAAWAGISVGILTILSVGRMHIAGVPWVRSWLTNVSTVSEVGGINDPGPANPGRHALVNLQYPLSTFIDSPLVVQIITLAVVGAAALLLVFLIRGRYPRNELLAVSGVGVLGLLVTYHRHYDAMVLVLPIAWGVGALATRLRRQGVAIIALCATFLLPIQTGLIAVERSGRVPAWLVDSFLWDGVLLSLQAWALLLLLAVILVAAARDRGGGVPAISPPSRLARDAPAGG